MTSAILFKITKDSNYFVKGQKVWLSGGYFGFSTGQAAYEAWGKRKGKYNWIRGWIHCAFFKDGKTIDKCEPNAVKIGKVWISDEFHDMLSNHESKMNKKRFDTGYQSRKYKRYSQRMRGSSPSLNKSNWVGNRSPLVYFLF